AVTAFDALLNPLLLGQIDDVHEFVTDRSAIDVFERLDDLAKWRLLLLDEERAGLEYGGMINRRQAMEIELQVRDLFTMHQVQGVEIGLLVSANAVGADQVKNLNLLVLMLGIDNGVVAQKRFEATGLTQFLEIFLYLQMRNIRLVGVGYFREVLKESAPFLGYQAWVLKKLIVQLFNV